MTCQAVWLKGLTSCVPLVCRDKLFPALGFGGNLGQGQVDVVGVPLCLAFCCPLMLFPTPSPFSFLSLSLSLPLFLLSLSLFPTRYPTSFPSTATPRTPIVWVSMVWWKRTTMPYAPSGSGGQPMSPLSSTTLRGLQSKLLHNQTHR